MGLALYIIHRCASQRSTDPALIQLDVSLQNRGGVGKLLYIFILLPLCGTCPWYRFGKAVGIAFGRACEKKNFTGDWYMEWTWLLVLCTPLESAHLHH